MTEVLSQIRIAQLMETIQLSLAVRRHFDLFHWLQNDIQPLLPHDILIAAWGDFSLDLINYDIVSPLPGIRTQEFSKELLYPFLSSLFTRWSECGHAPYTVSSRTGFTDQDNASCKITEAMGRMRCCLVHGIKDQRGRHDCLYVMLGPDSLAGQLERQTLALLLPYIDTAFRQVSHLPAQYLGGQEELPPPIEPQKEILPGVSDREREILEWVRQGKTNQEIGMILDISAFTVKNHLQRIYRKINVINRAQAVAKMEATSGHVPQ